MPRSGWAANDNKPKSFLRKNTFAVHLRAMDQEFFEQSGVTPAEWKHLSDSLVGRLVLPGMPDYNADRQSNPRFDEHPKGIAYCAVPEDVSRCLQLAREHRDMKITCRSGGHSTAGFSVNNGFVIDLSLMAYAAVDRHAMSVTAGAGTSFELFDSVLNTYALHVPSGGCPDVCVGGYMQGGGYGFTSRQFGINCDRVRSFTMVLPTGKLVTASHTEHRPLFWAVRGGTGNQFGVVTSVTYELNQLKFVSTCVAYWSLDRKAAPLVLDALQKSYMRTGITRRFGFQVMITTPEGFKEPVMLLLGMYPGSQDEVRELIRPLTDVASPLKVDYDTGTYANLNATLVDKVLPGPGTAGTLELKRCGYLASPLGTDGWEAICSYIKTASPNPYNMAYLEAYGGAINDFKPLFNAFIHRDVDCNFVIDSFWNPAWKDSHPGSQTQAQAQEWLDGLWKVVGPFTNGHVYQDYPTRDVKDYRWQYWGDAYPSLLWVKNRYDPTNLFDYGQAITPYPDEPEIHRSNAASLFDDSDTAYGGG